MKHVLWLIEFVLCVVLLQGCVLYRWVRIYEDSGEWIIHDLRTDETQKLLNPPLHTQWCCKATQDENGQDEFTWFQGVSDEGEILEKYWVCIFSCPMQLLDVFAPESYSVLL